MLEAYSVAVGIRLNDYTDRALQDMAANFEAVEARAAALRRTINGITSDAMKGMLLPDGGTSIESLFGKPIEVAKLKNLGFGERIAKEAVTFIESMDAIGISLRGNSKLFGACRGLSPGVSPRIAVPFPSLRNVGGDIPCGPNKTRGDKIEAPLSPSRKDLKGIPFLRKGEWALTPGFLSHLEEGVLESNFRAALRVIESRLGLTDTERSGKRTGENPLSKSRSHGVDYIPLSIRSLPSGIEGFRRLDNPMSPMSAAKVINNVDLARMSPISRFGELESPLHGLSTATEYEKPFELFIQAITTAADIVVTTAAGAVVTTAAGAVITTAAGAVMKTVARASTLTKGVDDNGWGVKGTGDVLAAQSALFVAGAGLAEALDGSGSWPLNFSQNCTKNMGPGSSGAETVQIPFAARKSSDAFALNTGTFPGKVMNIGRTWQELWCEYLAHSLDSGCGALEARASKWLEDVRAPKTGQDSGWLSSGNIIRLGPKVPETHIHKIYLDGRQIAEVVSGHQAREASRALGGGYFDSTMGAPHPAMG